MTAQIGDIYKFKEKRYTCLRRNSDSLFDPKDYGFSPTWACTACWRGYFCEYEVRDDGLMLRNLCINDANDYYPPVNGVNASEEKKPLGHRLYENVDLSIPYSGKVLLAADFIENYYIHMGFQRPHGYKTLLSFEFEEGQLIDTVDYSNIASQMRGVCEAERHRHHLLTAAQICEELPEEIRNAVWWQ